MEVLIVGIVTALNFLFIKKKLDLKRYEDALFDVILFVAVLLLFEGSYAGMVVGMIASLIISISFFVNPPKFIGPLISKLKADIAEVNKKSPVFPDWDGRIR